MKYPHLMFLQVCLLAGVVSVLGQTEPVSVSFVSFAPGGITVGDRAGEQEEGWAVLLAEGGAPVELAPLQATRFEQLAIEDGKVRFAVVAGAEEPVALSAGVGTGGGRYLVFIRRARRGFEADALLLPERLAEGSVAVKNFTGTGIAVQIDGTNYAIGPEGLEVAQVAEPLNAGLKLAVRANEEGRWRVVYSSRLGGFNEHPTMLCIYRYGRSYRITRVRLP